MLIRIVWKERRLPPRHTIVTKAGLNAKLLCGVRYSPGKTKSAPNNVGVVLFLKNTIFRHCDLQRVEKQSRNESKK